MNNKAFVSDYITSYVFHIGCCPSKLPKRYPAGQQTTTQPQSVGPIGLSGGYDTWLLLPIVRLANPNMMHCIVGSLDQWTFPPFCQSPLHSPNGRQMPAVRAVQGECERVQLIGHKILLKRRVPKGQRGWVLISLIARGAGHMWY